MRAPPSRPVCAQRRFWGMCEGLEVQLDCTTLSLLAKRQLCGCRLYVGGGTHHQERRDGALHTLQCQQPGGRILSGRRQALQTRGRQGAASAQSSKQRTAARAELPAPASPAPA